MSPSDETAGLSPAEASAWQDGSLLRPFEVLGAQLLPGGKGVRFAAWAPRAQQVRVAGDFNAWQGDRHPLRRQGDVWTGVVPEARPGDRYRYEVVSAGGAKTLKADPFAFAAELRPGRASRVAELPERRKLDPRRRAANRPDAAILIYEVHVGSWRRRDDGGFLDWDELARTLPAYAASLGFTHVELLPIGEHPFDGSWGYQCLGLFAPSSRFGEPQGLLRFVEACHAQGLGVLLDWVPAHFPLDEHGLARFDGEPLYEYADPREGLHRDWHTAIYDFGKPQVACLLAASALYWTERFGVDGLRVDAVASMIYRDYSRPSGQWVPNEEGGRHNLEAIELVRRINGTLHECCPGAITCAEESTAFAGVTQPVERGGLGFDFKWNLGWMHDTLRYLGCPPAQRASMHESISFGLVYAFDEQFVLPLSHDEVVHGKGSMLARMPGDEAARFAQLRALYTLMWGHPGKKLLFMGQEFAQPDEWNHDAVLPWHLLEDPRHAGVQRLVRELNTAYRELPALHRLDGDRRGFEWLHKGDAGQPVFAWLRHGGSGEPVLVVCHFGDGLLSDWRLPACGRRWRIRLDSGAAEFGGAGAGVQLRHAGPELCLELPPFACCYLVPETQEGAR